MWCGILTKISHAAVHGCPTIWATFSQAIPRAFMPRKLTIQYTTKEPRPYAVALNAGSVCDAGGGQNGIWYASDTSEYMRETKKYVVTVAQIRMIISCQ